MTSARFTPPSDLRPYAGFIFDCDGTLVDTMGLHFQAWQRALKEGGARFHFTWELFTSRAGMSLERTVAALAEQFDQKLDVAIIARRHPAIFHTLDNNVQPVSEVLAFAREVAKKFPVAVASGSTRQNVTRSLVAIDAADLFPIVITPESVEHGKPHPDMFLLAAEKMGVPAKRCLVLEDGEYGFEAARRAKMDYAIVESPAPAQLGPAEAQ